MLQRYYYFGMQANKHRRKGAKPLRRKQSRFSKVIITLVYLTLVMLNVAV